MQVCENVDYVKSEGEDVESIMCGIVLFKGCVYIQIGKLLEGIYVDFDVVVQVLDEQIVQNYKLFFFSLLVIEYLVNLGKVMYFFKEEYWFRINEIIL